MTSTRERLAAVTARYDGQDGEAAKLLQQAQERLAWRLRRSGKECSGCGLSKPLSEFTKDARSPDGLGRRCKSCHRRRRYGLPN